MSENTSNLVPGPGTTQTSSEFYVATTNFGLSGIKRQIPKDEVVEVMDNDIIRVFGQRFTSPGVRVAIRDRLLVPQGTVINETAQEQPPTTVVARFHNDRSGKKAVEQPMQIEHRNRTIHPLRVDPVNTLPTGQVPAAALTQKSIPSAPNIPAAKPKFNTEGWLLANFQNWNKLSTEGKVEFVPQIQDPKLLVRLAKTEKSKQVKDALIQQLDIVLNTEADFSFE